MSAHAVKDLHLTSVPEPLHNSEIARTSTRRTGGGHSEGDASQGTSRSGRPHPFAEGDNLEPHWVAAIDTATD